MVSRSGSPIAELLVVFLLVYILQVVFALLGLLGGLFVLSPPLSSDPWTIVTSVYAHSGVGHLLSNSIALVLFGWPIARATTRVRFHAFFLLTGAIAGVSQIVLSAAFAGVPVVGTSATAGVLGASGAVFALLGYLIAGNRLSEGLASVVEVSRGVTILLFVVLAAVITITTGAAGVALIAHFTGFLVGLVAGRARVLQPGSRSTAERSLV